MTGIILGLLSAATYGLIPLFTLPLMAQGLPLETIIVYRFTIAAIAMCPIMAARGYNLTINWRDFLSLALLSGFYIFAVIAFFHSFRFLPSSMAATLQFLYPVMVMLIMILFFHEKFRWLVCVAVILGLAGVIMLSIGADESVDDNSAGALAWGITLALLAGLGNSLYMAALQVTRFPHLNGLAITFYVMVFGAIYALGNAAATGKLVWIWGWRDIFLATLLALVTAVFSNLALVLAIQRIGSTLAAILGVMEPLTAVAVGVTVFHEPFTLTLALGTVLITASVIAAIFAPGRKSGK